MILAEVKSHVLRQSHLDHFLALEQEAYRAQKAILFAEDNDDLRRVMEFSLKAMGYCVIPCADGEIALEEFHAHPAVDMIMTDFEMPKRTGLELAREVTALRAALPVMIITGSCLSAANMQEIQERSWTLIRKPCSMPSLKLTLRQILEIERPAVA